MKWFEIANQCYVNLELATDIQRLGPHEARVFWPNSLDEAPSYTGVYDEYASRLLAYIHTIAVRVRDPDLDTQPGVSE